MKKAVQFGAGNIGRGFIGQLFSESGYEVVFVDVMPEVVNLLNVRRSYTIRIASDSPQDIQIGNVRAVNGRDIDAVAEELATADIACTAVGVNVLPAIAPALAKSIERRSGLRPNDPLNIIICENLAHADKFLRAEVEKHLPARFHGYLASQIGFVMSVVARMVPFMTPEQREEDALLIVVEAFKRLPVDRAAFKGQIPEIVGVEPRDNFQSYVDDKLFTHNCGHAVAAYLGYLRGHEFMWQAMRDDFVRARSEAAMTETGQALISRYGVDASEHREHILDLLDRFGNVALGDQVSRVGRDPVRKLGPEDRLSGAAKFSLAQGIFPENVCLGIAAGLLFDPSDDPTAGQIQEIMRTNGPEAVLRDICGLDPSGAISKAVLEALPTLQ